VSAQLRRTLALFLAYLGCLLGLRLVDRVENQLEARLGEAA
jgi:hypothetical protein